MFSSIRQHQRRIRNKDSQTLVNPYVVISGIENYSQSKPNGTWNNLHGVNVDVDFGETLECQVYFGVNKNNNNNNNNSDSNSNNNSVALMKKKCPATKCIILILIKTGNHNNLWDH